MEFDLISALLRLVSLIFFLWQVIRVQILHYRVWYQFLSKYGVTKEIIKRGFFVGFSLYREPLRTIYLQNSHFEAQLKEHRHRMRREARPMLFKGAIVPAIIYLLTFFLFGR